MSEEKNSILWKVGMAAAALAVLTTIGYFVERKPDSASKPSGSRPSKPPVQNPTLGRYLPADSDEEESLENPEEPIRQAQLFLKEAEAMLKNSDPKSLQWCTYAFAAAMTYIKTSPENNQRAEFLLRQAFAVHLELKTPELKSFIKIVELLYTIIEDPQAAFSLTPYFMKIEELAKQKIAETPNNPEDVLGFIVLAFHFSYNAASWSLADRVYQLSCLIPTNPRNQGIFLDKYTTGLHQQGRTLEGITLINEFIDTLQSKDDLAAKIEAQRFISRVSKFYFYYELFEESKKSLERLDLSAAGILNDVLEYYQVLSELKLESELEKTEAVIRSMDVASLDSHPISRSQFLMSMEVSIIKAFIVVSLRVCRARPQRKEGEPESEESAPRKLSTFFIVAQFEGTDEVVEIDVKTINFDVSSPPLNQPLPTWTRLVVSIYSDSTKSKLLGTHRQMICNIPTKTEPV